MRKVLLTSADNIRLAMEYLKNFNYRLYFSLLFLAFCPTLYSTIRVFFIGMAFDSIVSMLAYRCFIKRENIAL